MLLGDFNAEDTEPILSECLVQNEEKTIMKNKTCFRIPNKLTCIDLFLTNSTNSFQNTMTISTGLSDFHKMIITVLKSSFIKLKVREMYYRDYFTKSSLPILLGKNFILLKTLSSKTPTDMPQ